MRPFAELPVLVGSLEQRYEERAILLIDGESPSNAAHGSGLLGSSAFFQRLVQGSEHALPGRNADELGERTLRVDEQRERRFDGRSEVVAVRHLAATRKSDFTAFPTRNVETRPRAHPAPLHHRARVQPHGAAVEVGGRGCDERRGWAARAHFLPHFAKPRDQSSRALQRRLGRRHDLADSSIDLAYVVLSLAR